MARRVPAEGGRGGRRAGRPGERGADVAALQHSLKSALEHEAMLRHQVEALRERLGELERTRQAEVVRRALGR